jgi:hypothetical protein
MQYICCLLINSVSLAMVPEFELLFLVKGQLSLAKQDILDGVKSI